MPLSSTPEIRPDGLALAGVRPDPAKDWVAELTTLLRELEAATTANRELAPVLSEKADAQLVQARLGTAASLFAALKCKHAATAGHSLRVALTCSAWALKMGLEEEQRDAVEIAALLHDVGVIGMPDKILLKPGVLDYDEAAIMFRSRAMSVEILSHGCVLREILDIVGHSAAWYNGARTGFPRVGKEIPLGARMIAVVEAFDAMTTDHVYHPALSHERALAELFSCANTQFDPDLVKEFAELLDGSQSALHRAVAQRWLHSLAPQEAISYWGLNVDAAPKAQPGTATLFQTKLLENMYDAVVFVDAGGRIMLWNRGAERLIGIASVSICQREWQPELLTMCDEKGRPINEADCPVHCAIRSGVQSLRRLTIVGRAGRPVAVDAHATPVMTEDGTTLGAILLFHDASSETSMEQRCQSLYEKATKDPMTQVANRAEFDRVHEMFVAAHQEQQLPCSLMMCDLDKFKRVNDTYGHQAGDDAIRSLAALLKSSCRPGDLVARYGGEEFVVLCTGCDNATATLRAEQIRKALSQLPQPKMDGRTVTVSFGVTEIQPGDTPETMLRRADRALLMAKAQGRNTVVQLGSGSNAEETDEKRSLLAPKQTWSQHLCQQVLVTPVPLQVAIEKLRGFVADNRAKVVQIEGNRVQLEIDDRNRGPLRRWADRPVTFRLELAFEEERRHEAREQSRDGQSQPIPGPIARTRIVAAVSPSKSRDRRRNDVLERARDLLVSFRSYLMAAEEQSPAADGAMKWVKRIIAPWLAKK